jgi:subtilisin family serine protease
VRRRRRPHRALTVVALAFVTSCGGIGSTGSSPPHRPAQASSGSHERAARELNRTLSVLRVDEAQRFSTGSGATVAILDSGVDATDPTLAGRVRPGFDAITNRIGGADADAGRHGTAMAGLVGATASKAGVRGVAPDITIIPVRVASAHTVAAEAVAAGLRWAATVAPDVVLLAYAPGQWDNEVVAMLAQLRDQGSVVVISAGNRGPTSAPTARPRAAEAIR